MCKIETAAKKFERLIEVIIKVWWNLCVKVFFDIIALQCQ